MEGPREIRRGDIFWVVDPSGGSVPPIAHPHVVVQEDVLNASRVTTVVVCALTTNLRRAEEPGNVRLEPGEGGLPKPSVVVVSQVASVPKASLGVRIGALTQARVDAVLDGLALQQRSFGRTPPRSP